MSTLKFHFTFVCLLLAMGSTYSQLDYHIGGARSGGMANASVTLEDTWSVFNNPAGLANLENSGLGLFYENRFLVKETGYGAMAFNMPLGNGNAGVALNSFGYSKFQSNKIGFSYAQELFSRISMGVKINYLSIIQSLDYGNIHGVTFDLGLLVSITDDFTLGFHAFNPLNLSYLVDIDEHIPVTYKLGLSYLYENRLLLAIETGQSIHGDIPIFSCGFDFYAGNNLYFRAGVSAKPIEYTFGMGYEFSPILFNIAFAYHQYLGSTPKISINYEF